MDTIESLAQAWRERTARFRRMADMLGGDGAGQLSALAVSMEEQSERFLAILSEISDRKTQSRILLAEVDGFLARARAGISHAGSMMSGSPLRSVDLREEARLCTEEARATVDLTVRRALAKRALELALHGEKIDTEPAS